jgi:uncharacterized membrane protein
MKYVLIVLALAGVVVSSLALHEHYRTDASPCSINEKWDCGTVNKSPFAEAWGIPIAAAGTAGYLLFGVLAFLRAYCRLLDLTAMALGFSLYLAHIEAHVLGVWCVYCVASLAVLATMTLLVAGTLVVEWLRKPASP